MNQYPRDLTKRLRRRLAEGLSLDGALQELRLEGATIIECIKAVKEFRACDLVEAKRLVNDSAAWKDVVERTNSEFEAVGTARLLFLSKRGNRRPLAEIASQILGCLGFVRTEERFSSNYPPDDHYFVGYAENIELQICDADDERKPEYPFKIWITKATWRKGPNVVIGDENHAADILSKNGFNVFIPFGDWASKDWDGDGKTILAKKAAG
jgi:hypothetical protein